MRTSIRIALAALALFAFVALLQAQSRADGSSAKDLFLQYKCNMCHSIQSQGVPRLGHNTKPPDLSKVGDERNADWIVGWLNRTNLIDGKHHMKLWKGTPDEARTIADWLSSLKSSTSAAPPASPAPAACPAPPSSAPSK